MSDIVTLDINTYNNLKADAIRANMIVDHLFRTGKFSFQEKNFSWDVDQLNSILEITYPRRYANKIEENENKLT